ncbi:NAD(P)H-dependent glycerol-3-phosphate dehydrogenase [Cerasicoccus arenae]|uniref:Glycerol-3-phosphate dehydrogenase [NAD(P)+] n=1 Tax=Cerasicoccus arenae TaxID=424488 RepID=A0A8J3GFD0_9BACT|nr:NAD(P)H-dependent glycerol-3-phosphate dehydrogenase [Cerasicoccus arenae]MBK1858480.1 NAD(P)-dependent glycerol-3-phosphate dehydrogenase [Cerasicoccus arenae]GHC10393.1 glycerol-3-phosphate dehydrogenase [NAD(P)+] [Cerasicoccus arenae]
MNFAILGAGAWGTAMAIQLHRAGNRVTLAPRRMEHALALASERENRDYLPGYALPSDIQIGCEIAPVLMEADYVILACPSTGLRELCEKVRDALLGAEQLKMAIALCKGYERETLRAPAEIVQDLLPELTAAVLSGPTFAGEVAAGKPTAIVLAAEGDADQLLEAQHAISSESLRVYRSNDLHGVELGGSLKNVYAIGAGLCDGLKLGDNAKAAYLTRALAEMVRLGAALGGKPETFYGLSGFGDLIATCNGEWSRNRTFGEALAKGQGIDELLSGRKTVVEGYWAAQCVQDMAKKVGVDAPILGEIHRVCYSKGHPTEVVSNLMGRQLKAEH